ncbi:hypothetical protein [Meiothermus ruber]|uniref:hypothetical protein n=1 Tax=Meiothermus ruber TaxID=277 RepID=UPI000A8E184C|nr:hypothetical protein [Meiothermus ruber]
MSTALQQLLEVLLSIAAEELTRRFPQLPLAWANQFARELVKLAAEFANDPVQREAEIRALYARIEELLKGENP